MSKYVLFSPIGNHDPFGYGKKEDRITEGPLLHIIRKYSPQVVILFLTKEMFEKEEKDHRYTLSIKRLFPDEYNDSNIIIWDDGHNIDNPQNFDEFIVPYGNIFERINQQFPDYEILYNVSSGTPQMIASIILEAQNSHISSKAIQVESPERSANFKDNYSDGDCDYIKGKKDFPNRCVEPQLNSFRQSHLKSQISALIDNYEYSAAYNLIKNEQNFLDEKVISLIEHSKYRSVYDVTKARQVASRCKTEDKDLTRLLTLDQNIFEYFYTIKMKNKKNELADMVLKITPFLSDTLRIQTEKYYDLKSITTINDKGVEEIEPYIIQSQDEGLYVHLCRKLKVKVIKQGYVTNKVMCGILEYKQNACDIDKELIEKFQNLTDFEGTVRNIIAHDATSCIDVSKNYKGGANQIVNDLDYILQKTYKFPSGKFVYDDLNKKIKELL